MQLGAFALRAVIGRGTRATVYRAEHVGEPTQAAVKVLTSEVPSGTAGWLHRVAALCNAAALSHPRVLAIFDFGRVDDAVARASGGQLPVGTPWIASELARGGSLLQDRALTRWTPLKEALLACLEGLAHAHARGVVHGGLGPADVLWHGGDDGGWRIGDFGLLRPMRRPRDRPVGTPYYLAPEQLRPLGDLGPWTDLYALACIAVEMLTGSPPFTGWTLPELKQAHLFQEPPELRPTFPVPAGLQEWLAGMLEKDPSHRVAFAADAAAGLRSLGPPTDAAAPLAPPRPLEVSSWHTDTHDDVFGGGITVELPARPEDTDVIDGPRPAAPDEPTVEIPRERARAGLPSSAPPPPEPAPLRAQIEPPTPDWHSLEVDPAERQPGLAADLDGLRPWPLMGLYGERDALWDALLAVRESGSPRMVMLRGPSGAGKSRRAGWLAQRAHASGVAHVLGAVHCPCGGPAHGLAPLIERALGTSGLPRTRVLDRVAGLLSAWGHDEPWLPLAITEWTRPREAPEATVPLSSPGERHQVVEDVLGWMTGTARGARVPQRPAVVVLEDAQWGAESVGLAEHLLRRGTLGVLVLMTVRDEALTARAVESARIERLAWTPGVVVVDVERAVPGDPQVTWRARLEQTLLTDRERRALEVAAALGPGFQPQEWERACAVAGVAPSADLTERLLRSGLVQAGRGHWRFAHGGIREALAAEAVEVGRWEAAHLACAGALEGQAGAERVGRHLLAAAEPGQAFPRLLDAARDRGRSCAFDVAHALADACRTALDDLGAPPADPRRGQVGAVRVWLLARQGRLDEAEDLARELVDHARTHRWEDQEAAALLGLAFVHRHTGRGTAAAALVREARALSLARGDTGDASRALLALGEIALDDDDVAAAAEAFETVRAGFEAVGDAWGLARTEDCLGVVARRRGTLDDAEERHRAAMTAYETLGDTLGRADVWRRIGQLERIRGALERSERAYRRALALAEGASTHWTVPYAVGLARVRLAVGDTRGAASLLRPQVERMERWSHRRAVGRLAVMLVACAAAERDWEAFDVRCAQAETLGVPRGPEDADLARALRRAAFDASTGGAGRRRRALVLALLWTESAGDPDGAASLRQALTDLGGVS